MEKIDFKAPRIGTLMHITYQYLGQPKGERELLSIYKGRVSNSKGMTGIHLVPLAATSKTIILYMSIDPIFYLEEIVKWHKVEVIDLPLYVGWVFTTPKLASIIRESP